MMRPLAFVFLCALGLAQAREPVPSPTPDAAAKQFLPWLLQHKEDVAQLPLSDVILAATGRKMRAIDPQDAVDQRVLRELARVLDRVVEQLNEPGHAVHRAARINEVSRAFEDMIRSELNATAGLSCDLPKTESGRAQRSGYPDMRLLEQKSGRVYYLDPKLFAAENRNSSLRTFYYEPKRGTNKVLDDATHLLLGFEHAGRADGKWQFVGWEIIDLARFKVRLKAEFQGSNRDLYRAESTVTRSAR